MATSVILGQNVPPRRKVRTGCGTCRIRKVKCDEKKPSCQRCLSTGRGCDGYPDPVFFSPRVGSGGTGTGRSPQHMSLSVSSQDIKDFKRIFSTKTMRNVELDCDEEAKSVLEAMLSDEPLQHAVSSLRAIRQDLEAFGEDQRAMERSTSTYNYGLQQYCLALNGLVAKLETPTSENLRSALLCCQMFMSIEQTRANYIGIVQHFTRGHQIMIENHSRPYLDSENVLRPAAHTNLPFIDVFFIKLFAAPCQLGHNVTIPALEPNNTSAGLAMDHSNSEAPRDTRILIPNMRGELKKIAFRIRDFLEDITKLNRIELVPHLQSQKSQMLQEMELWEQHLDALQSNGILTQAQSVSIAFMRLFKHTLKIILTRAMDHSVALEDPLKIEQERLQNVAESLVENLKLRGAIN